MKSNLKEGDHHGGNQPDVDHLWVRRRWQGLSLPYETDKDKMWTKNYWNFVTTHMVAKTRSMVRLTSTTMSMYSSNQVLARWLQQGRWSFLVWPSSYWSWSPQSIDCQHRCNVIMIDIGISIIITWVWQSLWREGRWWGDQSRGVGSIWQISLQIWNFFLNNRHGILVEEKIP